MNQILISNATILYASVYNPRSFKGGPLRYGISFKADETQHDILHVEGVAPRPKDNLFVASSLYAPIITEPEEKYTVLREVLQIADARNIPRDHLLVGVSASIRVSIYDYNNKSGSGRALAVDEIVTDVRPMLIRAHEYMKPKMIVEEIMAL